MLSGIFAMHEANGAAQFGVYPYLKHFALNDQELGRTAILLTYASEQAMREIYLRPFEIAVKGFEGDSLAMMTATTGSAMCRPTPTATCSTMSCAANGALRHGHHRLLRLLWLHDLRRRPAATATT